MSYDKRTHSMTYLKLTVDEKQALKTLATLNGRSMTSLVRYLMLQEARRLAVQKAGGNGSR